MVFSSLMFMCIFLPIVLIAYNLSKNLTYKNTVLIIASLFTRGEPIWVVLLIFSAFVDYINGRIIDKYYARAGATIALVSSLVINLGLLAMFKYSGFLLKTSTRFYTRQSLIRISNCLSEYRFTHFKRCRIR